MNKPSNFISSKGAMLRALLESKTNCSVIGVHAGSLGAATYLTAVKEILIREDDEPLIILVGYDITGCILRTNMLKLSDISSVMPFVSRFENPFTINDRRLLSYQNN